MTAITTTPPHTDTAFDAIAAAFDALPGCEVGASRGGRCPNPARWHATFHDCGRGLICSRHRRAFLRQAAAGEPAACRWCGRVFGSIEEAVRLAAL